MTNALASGNWLIERRVTAAAALSLCATVAVIGWLFWSAHGTVDAFGRPLGTDFSNVWSAGAMALEGRAAEAWNWTAHARVQQQVHHDPAIPFFGWHYPPPFLLVAALLALLPYKGALIAWQAATLVPALRLATTIFPHRRTLLVAAGAPVVLVCLGHGHNGFLTAALFGWGLWWLDRRPMLAGLLLGCLVYKPQFALLIPLVLLVGAHRRAILGASLSAAALILATLAIWGWPVWQAFLDSLPLTRSVVIESGDTGWHKIQTAFAATRALGGSVASAYAVQSAVTAASLAIAALLAWRSGGSVRNAGILAAALLSTPYALDYDFTLAGVGIAFLAADGRARGFLRWEKTLLAAIWAVPLFGRAVAEATLVPLGFLTAVALLALATRRAVRLDGVAVTPSPCRRSRAASAR